MTRMAVLIMALAAAVSWPHGRSVTADGVVNLVRLPDGGLQPQAVVDAKGIVHVLYFKGEGLHGDLFYARLGGNGQFTPSLRVNSQPGSAIATGTMRGGQLALGRNGRVHVAWHGSGEARPKAPGDATPVMYARMNDAGTAFEPQRNLVQSALTGLDGGTLAADANGRVYIAWHAFQPGQRGEADRRVWLTRSTDDGKTFAKETPVSEASTGACGCCGLRALADRRGQVSLLYRAAADNVHRDTYLLRSTDFGATFAGSRLQEWNIASCPMSTFSLHDAGARVLAAWETAGQVQWTSIASASAAPSIVTAPGSTKARKHPVIAANSRGEVILVWTEGTGWNKGGGLAWQRYGSDGMPLGEPGQAPGVPTWGLAAVVARPDGGFSVLF